MGPNSLIVEGPADMLYLQAVSAQLEREGRAPDFRKLGRLCRGRQRKGSGLRRVAGTTEGMNVATLRDIQNSGVP
jgi:hypothetical protein